MTQNRYFVLIALFILQALCTVFFVGEALVDLTEPPDADGGSDKPLNWMRPPCSMVESQTAEHVQDGK